MIKGVMSDPSLSILTISLSPLNEWDKATMDHPFNNLRQTLALDRPHIISKKCREISDLLREID